MFRAAAFFVSVHLRRGVTGSPTLMRLAMSSYLRARSNASSARARSAAPPPSPSPRSASPSRPPAPRTPPRTGSRPGRRALFRGSKPFSPSGTSSSVSPPTTPGDASVAMSESPPEARSTPSPACASRGTRWPWFDGSARVRRDRALPRKRARTPRARPGSGAAEDQVVEDLLISSHQTVDDADVSRKRAKAATLADRCESERDTGRDRFNIRSETGFVTRREFHPLFFLRNGESRERSGWKGQRTRVETQTRALLAFAGLPETGRLERPTARRSARPPRLAPSPLVSYVHERRPPLGGGAATGGYDRAERWILHRRRGPRAHRGGASSDRVR